ncbi:MAG: S8 family serine peptidase [Gammaproteobacteria bacterium]|nr:S8 family serine peptidase [Gammaproteobacteria bacterium]
MKIPLTLISASLMMICGNSTAAAQSRTLPFTENFNGAQLTQSLSQSMEVYIELVQPQQAPMLRHLKKAKTGNDHSAALQALKHQLSAFNIKTLKNKSNKRGIQAIIQSHDLEAIKALPEVKRVMPVIQHQLNHINSVPWIGSPQAWKTLGGNGNNNGDPITVAIIDTGIDYYHQNLAGAGDVSEYEADDPNIIEPGSFPTAKVVDGWDFAGPDAANPMPDGDPIDRRGHGSHVAGSSAGVGVEGSIGQGVAPGAHLYAYKVFGDVAGSTGLSHLAIMRGTDPNQDGDTEDHVDVMNLSLGSSFGMAGSAGANAADDAAAAGVVVVISAGNSGNIPYIVGSPSIAPGAISVASSIAGGTTQGANVSSDDASVNGDIVAVEGAHFNKFAQGYSIDGALVAAAPHNGCSAFTNADDFNGEVALVIRGACGFKDKYANAQAAGASGIIVYNDGTSDSRQNPLVMGGLTAAETISGVMVSHTDGAALNNALIHTQATSVVVNSATRTNTDPNFDDTLSGFTSRGPGDGNIFKPDLAAPGQSIISTAAGTGSRSANFSGTSMAAPHVAGVAALLKQKWPNVPTVGLKAMMQNSSTPAYIDGIAGSSQPYPLSLQGVGRVQADVAATLSSYAYPGGVSFGRVNPTSRDSLIKKVMIKNLSGLARTYTVSHQPNQTMAGVEVSAIIKTIHVRPWSEKAVYLRLVMKPKNAPFDSENNSQSEVDGWIVLNELGGDTLRVGYMAIVDPASKISLYSSRRGKLKFKNRAKTKGYAKGFTLAGQSDTDRDSAATIDSLGWRNTALFGAPAVEFALTTKGEWGSLSAYRAILRIDNDEDGSVDHVLFLHDYGNRGQTTGTVTSQKQPSSTPNGIWTLTDADYDYNDRAASGVWIRDVNAFGSEYPNIGFLAPNDSSFDYELTMVNRKTGESDTISGSIDLTQEITVDTPNFTLDAKEKARVRITSSIEGRMLWTFQSNQVGRQSTIVDID